ncbi:hypothetical protein DSM3645_16850 [Blastopirellula marina DSM 3645]|uniref:Uncharacterized protein n=1 Tax=Blastopirellula marina DSM 3645 TaxID=314230 RepID=A3ZNE5_9BACT|nr:hypothetical protein DSM3645_16850 [Blastopirellula marina DSM 3645]
MPGELGNGDSLGRRFRWENAFGDELSAMRDAMTNIDLEKLDRRST